ncbi:hypothetical protein GCM10008018_44300 [Paenibacillus marchantiophytorum]|uniref:VOC domain-containing protein n=1 Tax=Paenibacillus marchantiophytorum TaxID=1619310 RepID=A0ABQ1EYF9_9BACL|nr:hypothetical protein [Paenibacillus marchantiophytorum]GFZ93102.1 hypothetical protein GCM10008018_44300 [Paenibacillus marchantiophytorum]
MKIHRIDHVGIIVNDLSAAKEFSLDFGLMVQGEWEMEGELMDQVFVLNDTTRELIHQSHENKKNQR